MSDLEVQKLQCYNKGCSQEYEELKNHSEACLHHPGDPFFHDAYKGWSCCKKKCTDFTEFLNIKGCKRSFHSNVKPVEPEKPKIDKSKRDEVIVCNAPKQQERITRPSENTPLISLEVVITPSLKQLLDKESAIPEQTEKTENAENILKVGTPCKNGACKTTYEGDVSNLTECTYHPGVPIFHEGLKYWSCCQRKTTEFNNFLEQEGCMTGKHLWIKEMDKLEKSESCRYDWHQTGSYVFISIYAKGTIPEQSAVKANPVKLHIALSFSRGSVFEEEFTLRGVIDVANSSVTMSATKVEVKLKKADIWTWDKLNLPKANIQKLMKEVQIEPERVETVSLDDI